MPDNFQYFGPGRKRFVVEALVFFDGHDELKLFIIEFAFLRGAAPVASPAPRAPAAFQTATAIHDIKAPVRTAAATIDRRPLLLWLKGLRVRRAWLYLTHGLSKHRCIRKKTGGSV
jgi:hypothetical protein